MKYIIKESQFETLLQNTSLQNSSSTLKDIWNYVENKTGQKFTNKDFENEYRISGNIKDESGGYNQDALTAFENLKKDCPGLYMDEDSYRTYQRQAELFIEYVKKDGSIPGAMKLRAIPGFSQHHTGKAFDVKPKEVRACVAKNASKNGFEFPYVGNDGIREPEPWHIYYNR